MALNYFTFGPYDSRDFGIYISGSGTFNAPEAEYETAIVPGRNGALLLPEHRLGNVELEYPAYIYTDFNAKIAAMRSAFLGLEGYQRLTDSYHPDEYRLAYFPGDVEVKTTKRLDAGSFTLTFICKPQRYLVDGEQPVEIGTTWGELTTKTGALVTFDGKAGDAFKSLTANIDPVQDLNGYSKPWVGGAGKNKLLIYKNTGGKTANGLTYTVDVTAGTVTATSNGATTANTDLIICDSAMVLPPGTYVLSGGINANQWIRIKVGETNYTSQGGDSEPFTVDENTVFGNTYIRVSSGQTVSNVVFKPMIRLASDTDTTFEPYSNICPITGWTGVNVVVSPTQDAQDGTTYPISWQSAAGTVYGGTLNVVSGVLKARPYYSSYSGQALVGPWISSMDEYVSGTTPTTGAQVVDMGGTETTYSLTAEDVAVLMGTNNVWADTGDVTLQYGTSPFVMVNPTQQTARPLIRVYGYGTLVVGDCTVTIASHAYTYIDIDCDIMDCHYGTTNCNSLVSFSTHEFPTFPPGATWISFNNTITKVEVEPDWWRA